jgi:hypothetical protein
MNAEELAELVHKAKTLVKEKGKQRYAAGGDLVFETDAFKVEMTTEPWMNRPAGELTITRKPMPHIGDWLRGSNPVIMVDGHGKVYRYHGEALYVVDPINRAFKENALENLVAQRELADVPGCQRD